MGFVIIDQLALLHPFVNSGGIMDALDWVDFFGNPLHYLPETPLGDPEEFTPILVTDTKTSAKHLGINVKPGTNESDIEYESRISANTCYWRHKYFPGYKAGRKGEVSRILANTKRAILNEWVRLELPVLREAGYEADDFASALCREYPDTPKYLITLDSDWSGLVDENTYWIDTYCGRYKKADRRSILDTNRMLERFNNHKDFKDSFVLKQPSDIYLAKWELGDKSDSIPGNKEVNFGVIDLIAPLEIPELPEINFKKSAKMNSRYRSDMFGIPNLSWE